MWHVFIFEWLHLFKKRSQLILPSSSFSRVNIIVICQHWRDFSHFQELPVETLEKETELGFELYVFISSVCSACLLFPFFVLLFCLSPKPRTYQNLSQRLTWASPRCRVRKLSCSLTCPRLSHSDSPWTLVSPRKPYWWEAPITGADFTQWYPKLASPGDNWWSGRGREEKLRSGNYL